MSKPRAQQCKYQVSRTQSLRLRVQRVTGGEEVGEGREYEPVNRHPDAGHTKFHEQVINKGLGRVQGRRFLTGWASANRQMEEVNVG